MKIAINRSYHKNPPAFPSLYTDNATGTTVILALSDTTGVVLESTVKSRIGEYEKGFGPFTSPEYWRPFNGTITLQND